MATFTRVNGYAKAGEFIGRDVKFVNCAASGLETSYTAADSNFEKVVRTLAKFCTITVVGTPASGNCVFMVEGLPTGNVLDVTGSSAAIATALATDANAASGLTTTWTIYDGLSGSSFAEFLTELAKLKSTVRSAFF
jgi:hypothetical protein